MQIIAHLHCVQIKAKWEFYLCTKHIVSLAKHYLKDLCVYMFTD